MSTGSMSALAWFAFIVLGVAAAIVLLLAAGWQLGWWVLGGFVFCHGWVHMFVAMPPAEKVAAAGRRLGLRASETRMLTMPLVGVAVVGFMLAGLATIMGWGVWGLLIAGSSVASMAVLGFFYNRQLILGLVIDAALLAIVVSGIWRP